MGTKPTRSRTSEPGWISTKRSCSKSGSPENGATFDAQQDTFLRIPRPTDIDADASGRLYVSSWKNGKFNYDGPNVGFVAQIGLTIVFENEATGGVTQSKGGGPGFPGVRFDGRANMDFDVSAPREP